MGAWCVGRCVVIARVWCASVEGHEKQLKNLFQGLDFFTLTLFCCGLEFQSPSVHVEYYLSQPTVRPPIASSYDHNQHTNTRSHPKMLQQFASQLGCARSSSSSALRLLTTALNRALQQQQTFSSGFASSAAAAGATPANAMQLIKELRQQSGAPISDVKVRASLHQHQQLCALSLQVAE